MVVGGHISGGGMSVVREEHFMHTYTHIQACFNGRSFRALQALRAYDDAIIPRKNPQATDGPDSAPSLSFLALQR